MERNLTAADKEVLQDAINRALKAAARALRGNAFDKVAEIYYRIAYMLNDTGDDEGAQNFANAAKDYKVKNQLMVQINLSMKMADQAYESGDFAAVAENYFMVSSLAELFGDQATAIKFKIEAEKFEQSAQTQPQADRKGMMTMNEVVPRIQSHIPSAIKLKSNVSKTGSDLDGALMALGLVCSYCGNEIDPDFAICPKCQRPI
ncbi:MAG TPA: hypothetical protein VMV49_03385 [Candidatus Deferrimicrobium sp.]|nr:hypothetical protein [Candidatus Deferrimicrobium sp.]